VGVAVEVVFAVEKTCYTVIFCSIMFYEIKKSLSADKLFKLHIV